jgi:hypothetical protein
VNGRSSANLTSCARWQAADREVSHHNILPRPHNTSSQGNTHNLVSMDSPSTLNLVNTHHNIKEAGSVERDDSDILSSLSTLPALATLLHCAFFPCDMV